MTVATGQLNSTLLLSSFRSILKFYFGEVSLSTIEKLSLNGLERFTILDIKNISKELNLECSYHQVSPESIKSHLLPCIAIDKSSRAVNVLSKSGDTYTIKESFESKTRDISVEEFNTTFDSFIFFSKRDARVESLDIGEQNRKDWFYRPIKRAWKSYVEIAVLTLFINIFGLALPLFTMNVYNRVVPNFAVETLFVLAFGVAVILLFDIIFKSSRVKILESVTKDIANELEEELFKKTLSIESRYDKFLVGTKVNLFRELSVVKEFFATKIIHLLDLPFFITAVFVIYLINPTIAIIPIVAAIISLTLNFIFQYPISNLHKESFKEAQSKHSYLVEQLQGQDTIKLANALPKKLFKWRKIISFYNHIHGKIQLLNSVSSFISYGVLQSVSLATIIVGVFCIHDGTLSVGGLIAVTILASRAMVPVIGLSSTLIKYKQMREALESLNSYWHLPSENQRYSELGSGKAKGKIEFDRVSFIYSGAKSSSISDISFTINPGEKIGIIGHTGAGKSTIQKLLTGIETPSSGRVFLDDKDISTIHPVELRENVSLMPQEPYLFFGTLKENLELTSSISKERMTKVLKATGLDELVKKSGSSESLIVGERGDNLSVGQRHLVALARVLLSDSPVIILDEPTTGLDISLERRLVEHLDGVLQDKTLIVITHRFAALDLVDRVLVINSGKIVADGKKDDIIAMLQGRG